MVAGSTRVGIYIGQHPWLERSRRGRKVRDANIGVSDIMTKSYGQGFRKVDMISILSKWALTHLLNINIGRKPRLILGIAGAYIVITICTAG